jgi:hypothetical protein
MRGNGLRGARRLVAKRKRLPVPREMEWHSHN